MFGRWSQENFLKYMREHFALDHQPEYQVKELPETTRVVNPAWREHLPKGRVGEERRLLQSLYGSEADLVPNQTEGTLTVRSTTRPIHYWAGRPNPCAKN